MLGLISRNAQFRLFWIGQTASMLGNYALPVALALFAALHFKSVGAVGLVLAARALGSVIMLVIGGALADMWDRRKLMIVSDVARLLLVAVLATSPGSLSPTVLVCLLLGCGEGLSIRRTTPSPSSWFLRRTASPPTRSTRPAYRLRRSRPRHAPAGHRGAEKLERGMPTSK
jgi:MFS family permease